VWTLVFTGLFVLFELSRPLTRGRAAVIAGMAAGALVVMYVPFARTFFELPAAPPGATLVIVAATATAAAAVEIVLRLVGWRPGGSGDPAA
jgi:hypothetical protein